MPTTTMYLAYETELSMHGGHLTTDLFPTREEAEGEANEWLDEPWKVMAVQVEEGDDAAS